MVTPVSWSGNLRTILLRFEQRTVVDIRELLIANMHDHVNFAVAVHILKLGGDRDLFRVVANNGGTPVDAGVGNNYPRPRNYHHPGLQGGGNKKGGGVRKCILAAH